MEHRVTIGPGGSITIPAPLRKSCGLKPDDQLIIVPSDGGLMLRPVVGDAIEIYSDERIAEFASDEEDIGPLLPSE